MRALGGLVLDLLGLAVEVTLRLPGLLWRLAVGAYDFLGARWALRGGALHCPDGHELPLEGEFECAACGYRYRGSALLCGNVECRAITPYLNCACGLSVRNPYRWGRP